MSANPNPKPLNRAKREGKRGKKDERGENVNFGLNIEGEGVVIFFLRWGNLFGFNRPCPTPHHNHY